LHDGTGVIAQYTIGNCFKVLSHVERKIHASSPSVASSHPLGVEVANNMEIGDQGAITFSLILVVMY
jgi:hypothetical protein